MVRANEVFWPLPKMNDVKTRRSGVEDILVYKGHGPGGPLFFTQHDVGERPSCAERSTTANHRILCRSKRYMHTHKHTHKQTAKYGPDNASDDRRDS